MVEYALVLDRNVSVALENLHALNQYNITVELFLFLDMLNMWQYPLHQ